MYNFDEESLAVEKRRASALAQAMDVPGATAAGQVDPDIKKYWAKPKVKLKNQPRGKPVPPPPPVPPP